MVVVTALVLSPAAAVAWANWDRNVDVEHWPEDEIVSAEQLTGEAWALGAVRQLPYYDGDPARSLTDDVFGSDYVWFSEDMVIIGGYSALEWESLEEDSWDPDLPRVESGTVLGATEMGNVLVVVVEDDHSSSVEQYELFAVDTSTGAELWRYREVTHFALHEDAVVISSCEVLVDDEIGDCEMTATGIVDEPERWTVEAGVDARPILPSGPDRPLGSQFPVLSFVDGEPRLSVYDAVDGDRVGDPAEFDAEWAAIDGATMVAVGAADADPSDGCHSAVAGFEIGAGEPAWEIQADTRPSLDGNECGTVPMAAPVDGRLAVDIDGLPAIVSSATGETVWIGTEAAQALGFNDELDVTAVWGRGPDNLTGVDLGTGEERWRSTVPIAPTDTVRIAGRTMWLLGQPEGPGFERQVSVVDLATGDAYRFPAQLVTFHEDEVWARFDDYEAEDADRVNGLYIWPRDLWS